MLPTLREGEIRWYLTSDSQLDRLCFLSVCLFVYCVQSVVGRELVQLEDLLHWAEGAETDNELVKEGQAVKELASGTIQLTDGLYSPQVEVEQFQTISDQVQELVSSFMEQVFLEHIEVGVITNSWHQHRAIVRRTSEFFNTWPLLEEPASSSTLGHC